MWVYRVNLGNNLQSCMTQFTAAGTVSAFQTSSLSFLANTFTYWKGSMIFRFVSNKTKFHAGRLLFAFLPLPNTTPPTGAISRGPTDLNDSTMLHSAVWDLASDNSFEFVVPYISPTPYTPVALGTGYLNVTVLDPLIAISTVPSSIEITVLVRGGPDFEFSQPVTPFLPIADKSVPVFAQSGGAVVSTSRENDCVYSIGERILSVKQLASKSGFIDSISAKPAPTSSWTPFLVAPYRYTSVLSGANWTASPQPYYHYFSHMYNFFRGSMCLDITTTETDSSAGPSFTIAYDNYYRSSAFNWGTNSNIIESKTAHVRLPYMDILPRSLVAGPEYPTAPPVGGVQATLQPSYSSGFIYNSVPCNVYVRAGDDFQMGYWFATPRLGFLIAGQTNPGVAVTTSLVPTPGGP
jgi:hypothetical protein